MKATPTNLLPTWGEFIALGVGADDRTFSRFHRWDRGEIWTFVITWKLDKVHTKTWYGNLESDSITFISIERPERKKKHLAKIKASAVKFYTPRSTLSKDFVAQDSNLQGIDYSTAITEKNLTDGKIMHYELSGAYGVVKQNETIQELLTNKTTRQTSHALKMIRAGEYGTDIQKLFPKRKPRTPSKHTDYSNLTDDELFDNLFS